MRTSRRDGIVTFHPANTYRAARPRWRRANRGCDRWIITLLALIPLLLVVSPGPSAVAAGGANTWSPTGKMSIGRT